MAYTTYEWLDIMFGTYPKAVFGNRNNLHRYMQIMGEWRLKNYLISLGMRY